MFLLPKTVDGFREIQGIYSLICRECDLTIMPVQIGDYDRGSHADAIEISDFIFPDGYYAVSCPSCQEEVCTEITEFCGEYVGFTGGQIAH